MTPLKELLNLLENPVYGPGTYTCQDPVTGDWFQRCCDCGVREVEDEVAHKPHCGWFKALAQQTRKRELITILKSTEEKE